jgi:hypothetical protein
MIAAVEKDGVAEDAGASIAAPESPETLTSGPPVEADGQQGRRGQR